jgi:hypothetical protein
MERDAKLSPNQFGNAGAGPQTIGPAVGLGALTEQIVEAKKLLGGQARCRTGIRFGSQAVGLAGQGQPTVNGSTIDADHAGNGFRTLALTNRLHRLPPATLEFRSSSKWSSHANLDASNPAYDSLTAQLAIAQPLCCSLRKEICGILPSRSCFRRVSVSVFFGNR